MDLKYALTHDLEKEFRDEGKRAEKAVTAGVRAAADGLKQELRRQTREAGLGNKLPRTWRAKTYPERGESLSAAAVVWTKAPKIMQVFVEGATIQAKSGRFLAIPTDAAPKRGIGRKRITPSNFPEYRFGKLRFVYRRGAPSLLVAEGRAQKQKTREDRLTHNKFMKASATAKRTGKGLTTVVMFVLVPQVRIKPRIDAEFSSGKWAARVPTLIQIEFRRLDAMAGA